MADFITYDSATKTYTVMPGASAADINLTIKNAPDGATIFLAAGNHVLTQQLSIWRDHITLKGAGAGQTILTIDQTGSNISDGIRISASKDSTWNGGLSEDVSRGARVLTLTSTEGLNAGDIIRIQQENDSNFLADGTYDNVAGSSEMTQNPLRESLVEIDHINGNMVYLKHDVAYDMQGGRATVSRCNYLKDVNLSDFTVTYDLPQADDSLFENTVSAFDNKAAMSVERTQNIQINNIEFLNVASHALEVRQSIEAHVDHIKTDGTLNKGSDGNGYSIHIAETFYSEFSNLELMNGRHAIVFSSWSAEAYNNIHVAMTNRDINYHGSPDHSNVVVVDRMIYEGGTDYTGTDRSWYAVGPGSEIHPASTIQDNITVFKHLESGAKADTVYGWDGGAYLDTKGGDDVIVGGASNDTIIGGSGNDVMAGGDGTDVYHFNVGDGNDVIIDFHGGGGGDQIILKNMLQFSSASDVVLIQLGADALLQLAGNNSILFKNFNVSLFTLDSIVLENEYSTLNSVTVSGTDTLMGGAGDDLIFMTSTGWNKEDWINLSSGTYDRIVVKGSGFYFNAPSLSCLSGVEVIDLRGLTSGTMSLKLNDAIVSSADGMRVKVAIGAIQTSIDTYGVLEGHDVHIYGAGNVTLTSNGTQRATLESKNGTLNVVSSSGNDVLKIKGSPGVILDSGSGSDAITISSNTNHNINGGEGNDKFVFTSSPTVGMSIIGGAGTDTIQFLYKATVSAIATAGWREIDNLSFSGSTNILALHSAISNGFVNIEGIGGIRSVTLDISRIESAQVIQMDENVNLTLSGIATGDITVKLTSLATGVFQGGAGDETIIGYGNADRLYGGGGNDSIDGGSGNDMLYGQDGNDSILGGSGSDTIYGENGNDAIDGGSSTDYLYGDFGDDILYGGSSSDYLYGGTGNDTLRGGANGDYLYGGSGADQFVIDMNDARDIIYDFNIVTGEGDFLDLQSLFDANGLGDKIFSSAVSGGFLKLTQSGSDVNIGFDVDGTAGSIFVLKTVATIINETVSDLNGGNILV